MKLKNEIILMITVLMLFAAFACVAVSADERPAWFEYEDGIVRDGSVGDEPGYIGDENVNGRFGSNGIAESGMANGADNGNDGNGMNNGNGAYNGNGTSNGNGINNDNGNGTNNGNGINNDNNNADNNVGGDGEDGRVAGVTDNSDDGTTFWGIILALIVGAAAILIAVLAIPTRHRDSRD